jgi:hypothetical protein
MLHHIQSIPKRKLCRSNYSRLYKLHNVRDTAWGRPHYCTVVSVLFWVASGDASWKCGLLALQQLTCPPPTQLQVAQFRERNRDVALQTEWKVSEVDQHCCSCCSHLGAWFRHYGALGQTKIWNVCNLGIASEDFCQEIYSTKITTLR